MTQSLASIGALDKTVPSAAASAETPMRMAEASGVRPFEKLLNAKMPNASVNPSLSKIGDAVSSLQRSTKSFAMTIRDYWKTPVPALNVSRAPAAPPSPASPAETSGSAKASTPVLQEIHQAIASAAEKYQVPHKLIESIVKAESAFNPHARSPVGAQGLMQLMPGTAAELGVKNPFNIHENIDGGVRYFKKMKEIFGSNEKALAAYNAGPGAVKRYDGVPPYAETRQYVQKIMKYFESGKVS